MKNLIDSINQTIAAKCNDLKNEVNTDLSSIVLSNGLPPVPRTTSRQKSTPPISYILYGLAGLSAIGALSINGFRLIGLGMAAVCAYGGYKVSQQNTSSTSVVTGTPIINLDNLKNEVSSKVITIFKKVSGEWDDFMQLTKNNLQEAISQSTLDSSQKDEMMNKVFIHEVFDISLVDFNTKMNSVNNINGLKSVIEAFKSSLLNAIDETARKQIEKYSSLL